MSCSDEEVKGSNKANQSHWSALAGGAIELTYHCPSNCSYCYVPFNKSDQPSHNQLSTQQVFGLIDQIVGLGYFWICFTGGDPLARQDFKEIYLYAKQQGLLVMVYTSGRLITEEILELFDAYPPLRVDINIVAATEATYDRITQTHGGFKFSRKAVKELKKRGIHVRLKTMIFKDNKHEFMAMQEYSRLQNCQFKWDPYLFLRLDGDNANQKVRLSPLEIVELLNQDVEAKTLAAAKYREIMLKLPINEVDSPVGRLFNCGLNSNTFLIDSVGRLVPCNLMRDQGVDLKRMSLQAGLRLLEAVKCLPAEKTYRCSSCHLQLICKNCPAWAKLENNDYYSPVDYLCDSAKLFAGELRG